MLEPLIIEPVLLQSDENSPVSPGCSGGCGVSQKGHQRALHFGGAIYSDILTAYQQAELLGS